MSSARSAAGDVLPQGRLGPAAVGVVGQVGPRSGDDPAGGRELLIGEPVIERRQQLSQRQVSGCAEHDHVEIGDRDDGRRHGLPLLDRGHAQ